MAADVAIFRWLGDDYLVPLLKSLGTDAHLSVGPEFVSSLSQGMSAIDPALACTWSSHDDTVAARASLAARTSLILYLDYRDDGAARARLSAALPDKRLFSLLFDVFPVMSVGQAFDPADNAPHPAPGLSYFILCPPRSGSYFLCDLLATSGCGKPDEHIRPAHSHLANYPSFDASRFLQGMMARGAIDSVFGTKIISTFFNQFFRLQPDAPQSHATAAHVLQRRGFKGIRLKRADTTAQAVSKYVADSTNEYRLWQGNDTAKRPPPYDRDAIATCLQSLLDEEAKVDAFFSAFGTHCTLTYEDLEADPAGEVAKILIFLGRPEEPAREARSYLVRQRNTLTASYASRFRRDMKHAL